MQHVANAAHNAADRWIRTMGRTPNYPFDVATTAAGCDGFDTTGREGQFYIERFVGHCVNVEAGTKGL